MSLLGIDVGTTGCKTALFSSQGVMLAATYTEYDLKSEHPGWAELETVSIWRTLRASIREVVARAPDVPIRALCVSSLGEALVPVTADRQILGTSILNFDVRGGEYLDELREVLPDEMLYQINGNLLGNHYSLTKLKWIREHQPDLYERTYKFLHWSGFVSYMLGADAVIDYSLANRTLLFDLDKHDWSDELLSRSGLDRTKLPPTVPSGKVIGNVSPEMSDELGLSTDTLIVSGAHDQNANAVGCGVINAGSAVFGMGTYICITPVFTERRAPRVMVAKGINTEHHAVPGKYVCFLYNQGGSLVKWFRDTFAAGEHSQAQMDSQDIYPRLFAEIPEAPSSVVMLPHFSNTGPPEFISDSCGVIAGLRLETTRGDILKSILEGTTYYLREVVDSLPPTGIQITDYRAAGGGSRSDVWIQTCADILGTAITRPEITEAGTLGAAIIAGIGSGLFSSYDEGVQAMVKMEHTFEPNPEYYTRYTRMYDKYQQLWPLMQDYLRQLASETS